MWLHTQSFQVIVVQHAWSCPNLHQIVSQVDLKNELSYNVVFCMWLGIHRSNKFVQSFQVDGTRHAQSDGKQQSFYFSIMNSDSYLI